jgi:hypothetical protein
MKSSLGRRNDVGSAELAKFGSSILYCPVVQQLMNIGGVYEMQIFSTEIHRRCHCG